MQNIKDNSRTEKISQFVTRSTLRTSPFGDNKLAERAYGRAERLVSATYLVTRHIDQLDPVRQALRQRSIDLLSSLIETRSALRTVGSSEVSSVQSLIREIISLVRILAVSGFLSFENAEILSDAYDELAGFIDSARRSSLAEAVYLSREELIGGDIKQVQYANDQRTRSSAHVSDKVAEEGSVIVKDISNESSSIKDARIHGTKSISIGQTQGSHTDQSSNVRMSRPDRTSAIMTILRESGPCGIKDIMLHTPEYSEKMIQRALFDLVLTGAVIKNGSKRWSTYQLNEQ